MVDQQVKKRKRPANGVNTPSKKVAPSPAVGGSITVSYVDGDGRYPALAASQGLATTSLHFDGFLKPIPPAKPANGTPRPATHNVLLHSSRHPRLDYTASPTATSTALAHYVAIFDPETGSLKVTPAYHTKIHAVLRSELEETREDQPRKSYAQQREALGQAFGTKKARQAIASKSANAITKGGTAVGKADEVQNAVLGAVEEAVGEAVGESEQLQALLAVKPIPKPDLKATTVEEVYPTRVLIPPGDMRLLQVQEWQENARADKDVLFSHRFLARRLFPLGKGDDITKLKALRYIDLLLRFHDALRNAGKGGKKVPKKEVLAEKLEGYSDQLIDSVRRRFSTDKNELGKWQLDNLYTHMAALTLLIDDWSTDISNLRDDLKMETRVMSQYFMELGCKIAALPEREREIRKLNKAQAATIKIAKLKLPLEFPKLKKGKRI